MHTCTIDQYSVMKSSYKNNDFLGYYFVQSRRAIRWFRSGHRSDPNRILKVFLLPRQQLFCFVFFFNKRKQFARCFYMMTNQVITSFILLLEN